MDTVKQEIRKISKDEVRKAWKRTNIGKAVGPDVILLEV